MGRRPIRIGLLGAGDMGAVHAAAYAAMPDVEVAGVFSRSAARAGAIATICRSKPVPEAASLIDDPGIDAIDVCLPTSLHAHQVVAGLKGGKHVFCETPLALRADEAQAMVEAARRAGRLLQVGLLMRSAAEYEHVEALARSGRHGRLLSLSTWRLGSYLRAGAADHKPHYGDPSTELLTFDFDFIRWVMGEPQKLAAAAVEGRDAQPGEISAVLSFADGRRATATASGRMPAGFPSPWAFGRCSRRLCSAC
jgi:predicted dehydrogenase